MATLLVDAEPPSPLIDATPLATGSAGHLIPTAMNPLTMGSIPDLQDFVSALDEPRLVLSESYIGADRRRRGVWAVGARATFPIRRALLRLDVLLAMAVLALAAGLAIIFVVPTPALRADRGATFRAPVASAPLHDQPGTAVIPSAVVRAERARSAQVDAARKASLAAAEQAAAAQAAAAQAAAAQAEAVRTATLEVFNPATSTPAAMGAAALALVRYPWQSLPGYSIRFAPISEAPSPGFYGNTTFTWGQPGGTSTMYVYPGETVAQLAGITAFEIAHEVDASLVEPTGGHAAIEGILGMHPASWAPNCDCSEQAFLSGWFAAAFAAEWSPGVGQWSRVAPLPVGSTAAAMAPWVRIVRR